MFVKMLDENTLHDRPQHKEENHAKIYDGFFHILFLVSLHVFIEIICTTSQITDAHGGCDTVAPERSERLYLHTTRQRNQHIRQIVLRLRDPAHSEQKQNLSH